MKMIGGDVLKNLEKVLESNFVLYVVYIIAFLNIIGYLAISNFAAVAIFLGISYITSLFTKSVSLSLLVSLFVTNFLVGAGFIIKLKFREGMENKENHEDEAEPENSSNHNKDKTEDGIDCSPCIDDPSGVGCSSELKAKCLLEGDDLTEGTTNDDKENITAKSSPATVDPESLKNIEGLMTRAEGLMNKIEKSGFKNMIGSLQNIMK